MQLRDAKETEFKQNKEFYDYFSDMFENGVPQAAKLDALPTAVLRSLVEDAIVDHTDLDAFQTEQQNEKADKQQLAELLADDDEDDDADDEDDDADEF